MSRPVAATKSPARKSRAPRRARPVTPPVTKLYLAYGSNLNVDQMEWRCPGAVKVGHTTLTDVRLVFRGVADVENYPGATCHVGIWRITEACERALDAYEGYNPRNGGWAGLYRKEYVTLTITVDGVETKEEALIYIMNRDGFGMPSRGYYQTIARGFEDFGLPLEALEEARELTREILMADAA